MLPVVDLSAAETDETTFRVALREAAHGAGFFYLVGHGVAIDRMRTAFLEMLAKNPVVES